MLPGALAGLDRKRLRRWLLLFFLALAVPTGGLVYQAYSQLKWEAFHQHRVLAEELAGRIDALVVQLVNGEEARSFADYAFLNVAGDPAANLLQRSPLSAYPVASRLPGLIGYFQVDTRGAFSSPLLPQGATAPASYGIPAAEWQGRLSLQDRIRGILGENRLVQREGEGLAGGKLSMAELPDAAHARQDGGGGSRTVPLATDRLAADDERVPMEAAEALAEQPPGQAAFDLLNQAAGRPGQEKKRKSVQALGRVEDLKLDYRYQAESAGEEPVRSAAAPVTSPEKTVRRERSALPEPAPASSFMDAVREGDVSQLSASASPVDAPEQRLLRIHTFESELDPFEFSLLDSGHLVLFRKVWRDGQRFIQGALIEQQPFLKGLIEAAFRETALSQMSELIVAYRGDVFAAFTGRAARDYLASAEELTGALLYRTRLSAPFGEMELIFTVTQLPAGPGGRLIAWITVTLVLVLCGGFYLMYRLGAGQIDLARQQQDFVSAVSHELKTPLTSIRMYGEMLREGWTSEEKKAVYYDYIYNESERLSRLITNVLQLARMTRNDLEVDTQPVAVTELLDSVRSRIVEHIERAGFHLNLDCSPAAGELVVQVDPDWFIQIIINLVDNAIKFSAGEDNRVVDIGCQALRDGKVQFSVRDYGPGIPADQMKKIFRLFYRSENELTRETVGTGIGLALVQQLSSAMGGEVDVVNREPGAEFRVRFSAAEGQVKQARA